MLVFFCSLPLPAQSLSTVISTLTGGAEDYRNIQTNKWVSKKMKENETFLRGKLQFHRRIPRSQLTVTCVGSWAEEPHPTETRQEPDFFLLYQCPPQTVMGLVHIPSPSQMPSEERRMRPSNSQTLSVSLETSSHSKELFKQTKHRAKL